VEEHRSLGIVSATRGYLDLNRFEEVIDQPSKPVVARNLLDGRFDAGLTHVHYATEYPERLRLVEYYGAVDTTWVVYGPFKRFKGDVIGMRAPWLFRPAAESGTAVCRNLTPIPIAADIFCEDALRTGPSLPSAWNSAVGSLRALARGHRITRMQA
jgi:hypothetical protein